MTVGMPYVVILELSENFANRVYGPVDVMNAEAAVLDAYENAHFIGRDDTLTVHPVGVTPDGELDGEEIAVGDVV